MSACQPINVHFVHVVESVIPVRQKRGIVGDRHLPPSTAIQSEWWIVPGAGRCAVGEFLPVEPPVLWRAHHSHAVIPSRQDGKSRHHRCQLRPREKTWHFVSDNRSEDGYCRRMMPNTDSVHSLRFPWLVTELTRIPCAANKLAALLFCY